MNEEIQDGNPPGQIAIDKLIDLRKWGAKTFSVQGLNAFCQYVVSIDPETGFKYIHTFINGKIEDNLFVQAPILRKEGDKMKFLDYTVGKDHIGWRVLE